jgi:hypothetical protein
MEIAHKSAVFELLLKMPGSSPANDEKASPPIPSPLRGRVREGEEMLFLT